MTNGKQERMEIRKQRWDGMEGRIWGIKIKTKDEGLKTEAKGGREGRKVCKGERKNNARKNYT